MSTIINYDQAKLRAGDHLVRGTAADGMIRAFAITARKTVQTARDNHHTSPLVTAALGRLMMGALMMGSMFKEPDELITLMVEGDGPVKGLTVTANCEGQVKGFANNPQVWLPLKTNGKLDVGAGIGAGTLTAIRDLPGTEPYSSQVELVSGEIGDDLTHYFTVSDQVPSSVGVGVLVSRTQDVQQAGGFIVQLMPGYDDYLVDELEANLANITSVTAMLEEGLSPQRHAMPHSGRPGLPRKRMHACGVLLRLQPGARRSRHRGFGAADSARHGREGRTCRGVLPLLRPLSLPNRRRDSEPVESGVTG